MRQLRAEAAARAKEVREAQDAEAAAVEECERLSRELALERLRAKVEARWGLAFVAAGAI